MIEIAIVAGTRPNFVKIAPLILAFNKLAPSVCYYLVHTGQHHDYELNKVFFEELDIPEPEINLNAFGGTQAEQTGKIMMGFEEFLTVHPTISTVIVVGDVNSTMACSIVAKKAGKLLIHIEAGIRSFDLSMPEEINRLVTDAITDIFYTTSEYANHNLQKAGIPSEKIEFVGNIMIDCLVQQKSKIHKPILFDKLQLQNKSYWLLTLHRPSNVDNLAELKKILNAIDNATKGLPIIFPVHPRTNKLIQTETIHFENIKIVSPLSYHQFLYFMQHCMGVITDSGGIQEETTFLNIPCLTLRKNTERPETIHLGSNVLINDTNDLTTHMNNIRLGTFKKSQIPPLWDGNTAERIVRSLLHRLTPSS